MARPGQRESVYLMIGDLIVLIISLWLTLIVRYQQLPQDKLFYEHLAPFSIIFIAWLLVYLIAGLYEKQSAFWRRRLPARLLRAQLINSAIAAAFFYLIPFFSISPKVFLFMDVVISFILLFFWRIIISPLFANRQKQNALLIAGGIEMENLYKEVNSTPNYGLHFVATIDLEKLPAESLLTEIQQHVQKHDIQTIVIDLYDDKVQKILSNLYTFIFSRVVFVPFSRLYEQVFDRIPLSSVTHSWFLENVSLRPKRAYDLFKRAMDIVVAGILFIISFIFYPFVFIAIKLEDRGPLFIVQERIGENDQVIKILKFRSMTNNDQGQYDTEQAKQNKITRVGAFLRKSRIDELPQLWNVLIGDISLIGPRPELPALVKEYEQQISYYNIRHLIKPGLSGWAQLYARHGHGIVALEETKEKLSYDLFYIKNRSFVLDIIIALKTIRTLLSRSGI